MFTCSYPPAYRVLLQLFLVAWPHIQGAAQVATRERVWLVDLMALRGGPGLAHVLPQLLRAPSVLKLGCSLSSDLTALVRMRSHVLCCT